MSQIEQALPNKRRAALKADGDQGALVPGSRQRRGHGGIRGSRPCGRSGIPGRPDRRQWERPRPLQPAAAPAQAGAAPGGAAVPAAPARRGRRPDQETFECNVMGEYPALTRFLTALAASRHILDITSLQVTRRQRQNRDERPAPGNEDQWDRLRDCREPMKIEKSNNPAAVGALVLALVLIVGRIVWMVVGHNESGVRRLDGLGRPPVLAPPVPAAGHVRRDGDTHSPGAGGRAGFLRRPRQSRLVTRSPSTPAGARRGPTTGPATAARYGARHGERRKGSTRHGPGTAPRANPGSPAPEPPQSCRPGSSRPCRRHTGSLPKVQQSRCRC